MTLPFYSSYDFYSSHRKPQQFQTCKKWHFVPLWVSPFRVLTSIFWCWAESLFKETILHVVKCISFIQTGKIPAVNIILSVLNFLFFQKVNYTQKQVYNCCKKVGKCCFSHHPTAQHNLSVNSNSITVSAQQAHEHMCMTAYVYLWEVNQLSDRQNRSCHLSYKLNINTKRSVMDV